MEIKPYSKIVGKKILIKPLVESYETTTGLILKGSGSVRTNINMATVIDFNESEVPDDLKDTLKIGSIIKFTGKAFPINLSETSLEPETFMTSFSEIHWIYNNT